MLEAMCHFNLDSFTHFFSEGEVMGPLAGPMVSQSYTFGCADGNWIAIHLSSPQKFWEGLVRDRAARAADRPALRRPAGAHPAPAGPDRRHDPGLRDADAATPGATSCSPTRCRIRRPTIPTRRWRIRRPGTCGSRSSAHHPRWGRSRTVRPPYSFDGAPDLDVDGASDPRRAWRGNPGGAPAAQGGERRRRPAAQRVDVTDNGRTIMKN